MIRLLLIFALSLESQKIDLNRSALSKLLEFIATNNADSLVVNASSLIQKPNLENNADNLFTLYLFKIGQYDLARQFVENGLKNSDDNNFIFNLLIKNAAILHGNDVMFEVFKIINEKNIF